MKSSTKPQIIVTPIPKYQVTEEDDELPNPMLESISSQKSQPSYSSPSRCKKLILKLNKSDQRKDHYKQYHQFKISTTEEQKGSYQRQYKQMDSLLPLLKLVQLNQKKNKTECFNGEEITIEQKVYFFPTKEILNIFKQSGDGIPITYEIVEDDEDKTMQQSISISEKMIKSMNVIKTFKKATNKIKSVYSFPKVLKQFEEENKRKQQADKMNQFINDNSFILKSDHSLGDQIIKSKSQSPQKDQINDSQHLQQVKIEQQNKQKPQRLSQIIQNSKTILKNTSLVICIFLLILLLAYIKTLNSLPPQIEDL
ncbi:unnamed protein product [Paramecium pentaurelia]|uniref:Transmembrane protein n=1 Tax=Paramecium pentaurelia TaxID=43138 RepID=A0A8S1SUT8_9CILI|nr:unnamed protein product [Paramecium pentaurelia]